MCIPFNNKLDVCLTVLLYNTPVYKYIRVDYSSNHIHVYITLNLSAYVTKSF